MKDHALLAQVSQGQHFNKGIPPSLKKAIQEKHDQQKLEWIKETIEELNASNHTHRVQYLYNGKLSDKIDSDIQLYHGINAKDERVLMFKSHLAQVVCPERRGGIRIDGQSTVECRPANVKLYHRYVSFGAEYYDNSLLTTEQPEIKQHASEMLSTMMLLAKNKLSSVPPKKQPLSQKNTTSKKIASLFPEIPIPIGDLLFGQEICHSVEVSAEIFDEFVAMGIPIIATPDSYIVQRRYRETLLQVMGEAYYGIDVD